MKMFDTYKMDNWYEQEKTLCGQFFAELAKLLGDEYEIFGSCNLDNTIYLIPKGTGDEVTYYGKPKRSFRISDHWNWRANLKKCDKEWYIQCLNINFPYAKDRISPTGASKPICGWCVAFCGDDGKYRTVFGDRWNRNKKRWTFEMNDPEKIADMVLSA